MCGMKTDMGGAAAMLGAFRALVTLRPTNIELHLVLCIAENAVGAAAFRPDDVVTAFSGRTVEINNTDAEGRLVLADGVAYASGPLQCADVIDMATLTGAQMVATGRHFAGIVSDDEEMESAAVSAGKLSGDLVHPLPYAPEFFSREFSSPIADMRNSVKDRSNAQASCAGQFIANHLDAGWNKRSKRAGGGGETRDVAGIEAREGSTGKDEVGEEDGDEGDDESDAPSGAEDVGGARHRWLHVDMAGPSTEKGSGRGTGFGVPLLVELLTGDVFAAR